MFPGNTLREPKELRRVRVSDVIEATPSMAISFTAIHVEGRRWFDSTYGNTYHSVAVQLEPTFEPGQWVEVAREPFTYGYGEQYLQTALELLQEARLLPKLKYENGYGLTLRRTCEHLNIGLTHSVSDVKKRELHRAEK